MAQNFSFDNAAFHFVRTDGPNGFLVPFILSYIAFAALATAINLGVQYLMFGSLNGFAERIAGGIVPTNQLASVGLYYLVLLAIGAIFWAVFEAAVQRRYVLDEGFSLKFGGDELRLLVVGLLWFVSFFGSYIVMIVALLLPLSALNSNGVSPIAPLLFFLVALGYFGVWIWVAVKLSAASALTIRDKKIRFFHSWGATRGRFWALFGAFLLLFIIVIVTYILSVGVALGVSLGGGINVSDSGLMIIMGNPQPIGPMFFVMAFVMSLVQALFLYIWAGPAALAAKTDPRSGGRANVADEFA